MIYLVNPVLPKKCHCKQISAYSDTSPLSSEVVFSAVGDFTDLAQITLNTSEIKSQTKYHPNCSKDRL